MIKLGRDFKLNKITDMKVDKLEIKVFNDRMNLGIEAAKDSGKIIRELLKVKENINVIFGAAPSQNEFIASLVSNKLIHWNCINAFHMDEYVGLTPDSPQRLAHYLEERLVSKVQFKSVNYMDGSADDIQAECDRYSKLLMDFPVDIVCMGIGENGHIAFNDPHVALFDDGKLVKVIKPDEKCRKQQVNDGNFKNINEVPNKAITLTIPALMAAKYIFCMVPDKRKAEAVFNAINGDITEECPASILRTHDNAKLYTDINSASLLINK